MSEWYFQCRKLLFLAIAIILLLWRRLNQFIDNQTALDSRCVDVLSFIKGLVLAEQASTTYDNKTG